MMNCVRTSLLSAVLVVCLAGCGSDHKPSPRNAPPVREAQTAVAITVGVPAARSLIANISGANGSVPLGGQTAISTSISDDFPLVIATSASNEIVLASFQRSGRVELNGESTAGALVRLLLGNAPAGVTEQEWMRWIADDTGFPKLVGAVNAAIEAGRIPARDDAVIGSITAIADRIMLRSRDAKAPAMRLLAERDVKGPLPYKVRSLPIGDIRVTGGLVNVHNSTPLTWSARTATFAGRPLEQSTLLPSADRAGWLLSRGPGWVAPAGQALAGDGDRAFYLTVEQTDASRRKNLVDMMGAALGLATSLGIGNSVGTCTAELVEALVGDELVQLAAAPDGERLAAFLRSAGSSAQMSVFSNNLLGAPRRLCPGDQWLAHRDELVRKLMPLAARLMLIARVAEIATVTSEVFMLGGRVYWMKTYWKSEETVRVCVAANAIANCAHRFEINGAPDLTLLEGAQYKLEVSAFDADGIPTLLPSSVRFSSENADITVDAVSGLAKAGNKPGAALITVQDVATRVVRTATVKVDGGKLDPASLLLEPNGASGSVTLVSASGGPIKTSGVALAWTIADPAVARLLALEGAATGTVFPQQSGETTIIVNNPVSGKILSAPVRVGSGSFAFEAVVRVPGSSSALGCTTHDNGNDNGDYSFDLCGQNNDALIRCVGSGCTPGRFYAAIAQSRLTLSGNCTFPIGGCVARSDVQEVYGIDPASTATFNAATVGVWWYGLADGGWVKAWPSQSNIGPNVLITKNIVIRDASTAYYPAPYLESARLDLVYRVYDRERGTYVDIGLASTIP